MGLIASKCKRKQRGAVDPIIDGPYNQTSAPKGRPSTRTTSSSDHTRWSAISREPQRKSSLHNDYDFSAQQHLYATPLRRMRGQPDFPLFSTPFYLPPFDGTDYILHRRSNPYMAQASNRSAVNDSYRFKPDAQVPELHRNIIRVESPLAKEPTDGPRLVKRSVSTPIDMFLIDISNEHVALGQPVSMNIRHLLLNTTDEQCTNSASPSRVEPSSTTTYARENLLNYIPYVCERFPNTTVQSDQVTRNTLHVRMPSQISRSLNALT